MYCIQKALQILVLCTAYRRPYRFQQHKDTKLPGTVRVHPPPFCAGSKATCAPATSTNYRIKFILTFNISRTSIIDITQKCASFRCQDRTPYRD